MSGKKDNLFQKWCSSHIERRKFIKIMGVIGGATATLPSFINSFLTGSSEPDPKDDDADVRFVYSVCQNCHSRCGLRAKIKNGVLIKLDGNPYHPACMEPYLDPSGRKRLDYSTPITEANKVAGSLCAKGQAGVQVVYNPLRIKGPLRRVGDRGSGQWESITWEQALDEIVNGGPLGTPGLAQLRDLVNNVSSDPVMGKKVNQVAWSPGRFVHGQKEFTDRWFRKGYGTINSRHDHTSICEASRHKAYNFITGKDDWKPDIINSKCLVFMGTNPFESNFPSQALGRKIVEFKKRGGKLVVVDPRFSNTASKADLWVPIKPGTDGAFALGLGRYIIEQNAHDIAFLSSVNGPAAGEKSWTTAAFLVRTDTMRLLKSEDIGLPAGFNVVWKNNAAVETSTASMPPGTAADLEVSQTLIINGTPVVCKSAFSLYKERVFEKTLSEWESICDIPAGTIAKVGGWLVSAGKQGVLDCYRGPVKHPNGTYNALSIFFVNMLLGNIDWKGGYTAGGGHYHEMGVPATYPGQVDLTKVPGAVSASGVQITRAGSAYDDPVNTPLEFLTYGYDGANGHPKRPWYKHATYGVYQELIPSIEDEYPYPLMALITYWNAIPYSTPAAREVFEREITRKGSSHHPYEYHLPLFISFDIEFGEISAFADYILPDTTYLERWSTPHTSAAINAKISGFRQPVVGKFCLDGSNYVDASDPSVTFENLSSALSGGSQGAKYYTFSSGVTDPLGPKPYYIPVLPNTMIIEDIFILLGKKLGLPGVGTNAFDLTGAAGGYNWTADCHCAWHWYQNIINNWAIEAGIPVGNINQILQKGGIFEDPAAEYNGNYVGHPLAKQLNFYIDALAATKNPMTGIQFDGLPKYEPIRDAVGNIINDSDYPFHLVTYKQAWHAMARTISLPWLLVLQPENFLEMNNEDGAFLGLKTGDMVRIISPTGEVRGRVRLTPCMKRGIVAIAHSFGHWEQGSRPHYIDYSPTQYDSSRGAGIPANPIMRLDPHLGNVCLTDPIGGSASFYDTRIKVVKA